MQLFEWNDELAFGINEIDVQHKWLVDHINEFYEQYKSFSSSDATLRMLDALIEYMAEHFESEEGYLARRGYPDLEQHKKEHIALGFKVYDLNAQFRQTGAIPLDEFAGFLLEWIYGHIKKSDLKYVSYFRSLGTD